MRTISFIVAIALALACTGCAVHPLPENFEGVGTNAIVKSIRCEARLAVEEESIERLRARQPELAEELDQHREQFYRFDAEKRLTKQAYKDFFYRYVQTALALDFTFDISEDNNDAAQIDFLRLISNGTVSLALKASSDRMRENARKFVIVDTFYELINDKNLRDCPPAFAPENLVYPVTGSIGLREVIKTFLALNEDGLNLIKQKDPTAEAPPPKLKGKGVMRGPIVPKDNAPVFADRLTFTTTFSGSVSPHVALNPTGRAVHLADATLTDAATRTDKNIVYIGLSLEPTKPEEYRLLTSVFARRGLSQAGQRASEAIQALRQDSFQDRAVLVVP